MKSLTTFSGRFLPNENAARHEDLNSDLPPFFQYDMLPLHHTPDGGGARSRNGTVIKGRVTRQHFGRI